ncbi:MAG: ATP-binding protein [Planctomycetota bacterium]
MGNSGDLKTGPFTGLIGTLAALGLPAALLLGLGWADEDRGSVLSAVLPALSLASFLALFTRGGVAFHTRSTLASLAFLWFGLAGLSHALSLNLAFGSAPPDFQGLEGLWVLITAVIFGLSGHAGVRERLRPLTRRPEGLVAAGLPALVVPILLPRVLGFDVCSRLPEAGPALAAGAFFALGGLLRLPRVLANPRPAVLALALAGIAGAIERFWVVAQPGDPNARFLALWVVAPPVIGTLVEDLAWIRRSSHARLRASLLAMSCLVGAGCALLSLEVSAGPRRESERAHRVEIREGYLELQRLLLRQADARGAEEVLRQAAAELERSDPVARREGLVAAIETLLAAPRPLERQRLAARLGERASEEAQRGDEAVRRAESDALRRGRLPILLIVAGCGLAVLLVTVTSRRVVSRLDDLVQATRHWSAGDLDRRVVSTADDEIGRLSFAFNAMAERLALQKRELLVLAEAVQGSTEPMALLDDRLRVRFVNSAFLRRTGRVALGIVGRPCATIIADATNDGFADDVCRALGAKDRFSADVELLNGDGQRIETRLTVSRVDSQPESRGYLAVFRDVSAMRQLERERSEFTRSMVAINRAAQRLVDDLESIDLRRETVELLHSEFGVESRIWLLPADGDEMILAASSLDVGDAEITTPVGEGLAGCVAVNRQPLVCVEPDRSRRLFSATTRGFSFLGPQGAFPLIGNGRVLGVLEMTLPDQGHGRSVEALVLLARILSGALANAELYRRSNEQREQLHRLARRLERAKTRLELNASDLEAANAKLVEAGRAQSLFLSTASHELRTPVSSVLGLLNLVLDGGARDEDDARDLVRHARDCGVHLLRVVNDVLDIARIEAGRLEIDCLDAPLAVAFDETRALAGITTLDRPIDVRFEDPGPLAVYADPHRVVQILVNLVGNALKFTPEGRITIEVADRSARGFVEIAVVDTGIGLDPEECGRVFDVFTQADGSDTRAFGGSGLGLAISRRLAGMMGGTLRLESEGPGRGARCVLTLPRAREGAVLARRILARSEGELRGRVLLVDGDPRFLDEIGDRIAAEGWQVLRAETADDAREIAITTRPDWILAEFALPHASGARLETGFDLGRDLLEDDTLAESRFAILTGLDPERDPLRGARAASAGLRVFDKTDLDALVAALPGRRPLAKA